MFGWLKQRRSQKSNAQMVPVFLNPLVVLLAGAEHQKGAPLTKEEVTSVRDSAVCIMMTPAQAKKFYASLDSEMARPILDPETIWNEWQRIRQHVE
ncbi:MAG: hypothetical protein R3C10_06385 [Pirellulales bacterium]